MARDLPSNLFSDALSAGVVAPAFFVKFETSQGTVHCWSGLGNFELDGDTYLGTGHLGKISPAEESGDEIRADNIVLEMSGIPNSELARALTAKFRNRACTIRMGLFQIGPTQQNTGELLGTIIIFRGKLDAVEVEEGPEFSTIRIDVENQLADLDRPRVRRYTDQDQKAEYPGDRGMEYIAGIQSVDIRWLG